MLCEFLPLVFGDLLRYLILIGWEHKALTLNNKSET